VSKIRVSHVSIAFMATTTAGVASDVGGHLNTRLSDQNVADAANALYRQSNTGVNMHMIDNTEDPSSPWLACMTASASCSWQPLGRLSAVVLNHLSWNEAKQQITTFGTMNAVGWIGTDNVTKELTNCIFPGDGGTMRRSHTGCGCISTHPEACKEDGMDWCPEDSTPWDGVCAMHPEMVPEMLAQFKQRGFPYNEAVVDGKKWNDDVSNNIHAFVVPTGSMGACGTSTKCYTDFKVWYKSYKAQHGSKTILGFDVTDKTSPFAPFPQPAADMVIV